MELTYKKIPETDKQQLFNLVDVVLKQLSNPDFFLPYSQWELDHMFDEINYAYLYGAYVGNKLVGSAQLYLSAEIYDDAPQDNWLLPSLSSLKGHKICEFGGALVLPEYRNKGIMTNLGSLILKQAKDLKFDYIIATANPDDIPAWKSVEKLGFDFIKQTTLSNGWLHKLYVKILNEET